MDDKNVRDIIDGGEGKLHKKDEKPPKKILLVPNMKEYVADPTGNFVLRADLRGTTRKEAREEKKRIRKARIKELKARGKLKKKS